MPDDQGIAERSGPTHGALSLQPLDAPSALVASRRGMTDPPSTVLDAVADLVLAWDAVLEAIRRYSRRAVRLTVLVNGDTMPIFMPNDDTADVVLAFSDRFGDATVEPGPVTWSVSDPALAEITPDPTDDTKATVKALAGSGTFRIAATSGTLSGESDDISITPGAASVATISVTLEPPTP